MRVTSTSPGGELRPQLLGRRDRARVQQRVDLLGDRLADPGQLHHAARAGELLHRRRRIADRLGRIAVGDHPVDDGAVELVEVAELVERGGYLARFVITGPSTLRRPCLALWLVLPTYNEAENIELVRARRAAPTLAAVAPDHHVLVVDDSSPDGTGADRRPAGRRAARGGGAPPAAEGGLGRAYLAGFDRALASGADLVLEMDADFSHDPGDLPRLIEAVGAAPTWCSARATCPAAA